MSATQRSRDFAVEQADDDLNQHNKDHSSTQLLEKILLSSSSSSSRQKIQTHSTNHQISKHNLSSNHSAATSTLGNPGGVNGGQYTYRGVAFNNTGKNWRKLITPAHDSFKKLQQQRPEYSGIGGSHITTQKYDLGCQNPTNSNNTSLDTSNLSVKEFNPDLAGGTAGRSVEIDPNSSVEEVKKVQISRFQSRHANHHHSMEGEQSQLKQSSSLVQSQLQMQSLLKSFSSHNFQYYENLHKKYFEKAKEKNSNKNSKPPTSNNNMNLEKSEHLFSLTSKTSTLLGLSQMKQSAETLKVSIIDEKPSVLRVSSLNERKSKIGEDSSSIPRNTMSINFKNSLFQKVNHLNEGINSVFLDASKSYIHFKSNQQCDYQKTQGLRKQRDYFDTSSSSSSEEEERKENSISQVSQEETRQAIDFKKHIQLRHNEALGTKQHRGQSHHQRLTRDTLEEELLGDKYQSILSRRDLSANHDDSQQQEHEVKTPRQFIEDIGRLNKFQRQNSRNNLQQSSLNHNGIPKSKNSKSSKNRKESDSRIIPHEESQDLPSDVFQGMKSLISSEQNHPATKMSMIQSSLFMSGSAIQMENHQNYLHQDATDIIYEQPTREEPMGDTYQQPVFGHGPITRGEMILQQEELRPEDLTTMIDHVCTKSQLQSSEVQSTQSNDILKTFQEQCRIARTRQAINDQQQTHTNQKINPLISSQHNSLYGANNLNMNSDKQSIPRSINQINKSVMCLQSAAPVSRQQKPLTGASGQRETANLMTTNAKKGAHYLQGSSNNYHYCEANVDQRSDFTFVLSNPTDFNNECNCKNLSHQQDSFITQKHARLLQNSESIKHLSIRQQLRNRLPEIAASPIYSESGMLPPAMGHYIPQQMLNKQCQNCGDSRNSQEGVPKYTSQNRQSQKNLGIGQSSIKEESVDEDDEQNQHIRQKPVFEYASSSRKDLSTGRQIEMGGQNIYSAVNSESAQNQPPYSNRQQQQSMEEEVKFLRLLLSVSYEYMSKIIAETQISSILKAEIQKVLSLISNVNNPNSNSNLQGQSVHHEEIYDENQPPLHTYRKANADCQREVDLQQQYEEEGHNHDQFRLMNDDQQNHQLQECDGNMTMSELQLANRDNRNPCIEKNGNLQDSSFSDLVASEQAYQKKIVSDSSKQSELVIVDDQVTEEQLPRKIQRGHKINNAAIGKFKSSLISQQSEEHEGHEDTVYSYLENEDPERDEIESEDERDNEGELLRLSRLSRNHLQSTKQIHDNNRAKMQTNVKKSLRETKHCLTKTKKMLIKERQINRQQEDMLKTMRAQIEALNERWRMTEERIRSGENMYNILSRTTSAGHPLLSGQYHQLSMGNIKMPPNPATPPPSGPIGLTNLLGTTTTTTPCLVSTVGTLNDHSQSTFHLLNNNSKQEKSTNNSSHSPIQISHFQSNTKHHFQSHTNLATTAMSSNHTQHYNATPQSFNAPSTSVVILDSSLNNQTHPKTLIDINERLTKQIEDNLTLFDNLNKELVEKDAALLNGEKILNDKDREVKKLKQQLKTLDESMRQLVQVTKITTEATEASKVRHYEEMESMKKRQEDYQKKIARIQSVFEQNTLSNNSDGPTSCLQEQYKLKYGSTKQLDSSKNQTPVHEFSTHTSRIINDDELSIGQIQSQTNDPNSDLVPSRLKRSLNQLSQKNLDKENMNPNSKAAQQLMSPFSIGIEEDSSALLKYSQDITANSQLLANTMKYSQTRV